jgi:hypothetical protein
MFDLRLGGMGMLASASLTLAAPAMPDGCGTVDPGTGGTAGVAGRPGFCGDGQSQYPEQCDGEDFGNQLCTDFNNYTSGTLRCTSECQRDFSNCVRAEPCGNGVLDQYEQCDGAQVSPNYDDCPWPTSGTVTCNSECKVDTSTCVQPVCGNGVVEKDENCDGPNMGAPYENMRLCSDLYFATSIFGVPTNYTGGALKCTGCKLDLSECTVPRGCYVVGYGRAILGPVCY